MKRLKRASALTTLLFVAALSVLISGCSPPETASTTESPAGATADLDLRE
jgi:hypothetical protein